MADLIAHALAFLAIFLTIPMGADVFGKAGSWEGYPKRLFLGTGLIIALLFIAHHMHRA